jgi:uncharacterized alpha/beta hydrolase family protein
MKRILLSLTVLLAFAVLIATTINSSSAQNYNWPAERAVRQQIINDAIRRQATGGRGYRSQRYSARHSRRRNRRR